LRIAGGTSSSQQALRQARDALEQIIVGDVRSADTQGFSSTMCGADPSIVDDINICVRFRDLPGTIIGLGGPRLLRNDVSGSYTPATGEISIDTSLLSSYNRVLGTAVS